MASKTRENQKKPATASKTRSTHTSPTKDPKRKAHKPNLGMELEDLPSVARKAATTTSSTTATQTTTVTSTDWVGYARAKFADLEDSWSSSTSSDVGDELEINMDGYERVAIVASENLKGYVSEDLIVEALEESGLLLIDDEKVDTPCLAAEPAGSGTWMVLIRKGVVDGWKCDDNYIAFNKDVTIDKQTVRVTFVATTCVGDIRTYRSIAEMEAVGRVHSCRMAMPIIISKRVVKEIRQHFESVLPKGWKIVEWTRDRTEQGVIKAAYIVRVRGLTDVWPWDRDCYLVMGSTSQKLHLLGPKGRLKYGKETKVYSRLKVRDPPKKRPLAEPSTQPARKKYVVVPSAVNSPGLSTPLSELRL